MINPRQPDYNCTPVSSTRCRLSYTLTDVSAAPFATIVTPFFNTGELFRETAESVVRQSLQQWEWLIINDGSTHPASLAILDEYRNRDPRIRVIDHPENQGLSAARNTGFRLARAKYVVQLDSDDLLEPTAVEKWCWYLESHPEKAFVKGWTVQFGASCLLWTRGFHEGHAFLEQNLVNPTAAIRKSVHEAARGYDEQDRGGLMDWDFWLRCAEAGHWGGTIPEYLDWYRRRPSHNDLWPDFDGGKRQKDYGRNLRLKYPRLWNGGFPDCGSNSAREAEYENLPCGNVLARDTKRLLLLIPWMCLGGADRFNLDLLEQLRGRGWEITLATTLGGDHSWMHRYAEHTSDIFALHHFLRPADYGRFLRYLIDSRNVDAVFVTHSEVGYMLLPYLRAYAPHVPVVDYCHIEEEAWKAGGYPRMSVDARDHLDLHIVSSSHLKEWMVQKGADPERIRICHTNVDTDRWHPDASERMELRRHLGLTEDDVVILFAGRFNHQKRPHVLLETLQQLCDRGVAFTALIVGEGPERPAIESFLKNRSLGTHARLMGEVSSHELARLMRGADLFFLPSEWEGIAVSVFEAMASGLPVVGADVGGQRELVTPECGVLVECAGDAVDIARYAAILEELAGDPVRRAAMGAAARQRVAAQFKLCDMGETMTELLEEASLVHRTEPQPAVPLSAAREAVVRAEEHVQLSHHVAEALFATGADLTPRYQTYRLLSHLAAPAYRLAGRRNWTWFFQLGENVKRVLFSMSDR